LAGEATLRSGSVWALVAGGVVLVLVHLGVLLTAVRGGGAAGLLVNLGCDALSQGLGVLSAVVIGGHVVVAAVSAHGLRPRHLVGAGVRTARGALRRTLGHASIVRRVSGLLHLVHYRSHVLSLRLHMRWDAVRTHLALRTSTILPIHHPRRLLPHPPSA